MPRRRTLSREERDLWSTVARTAKPMHNPHLPVVATDPTPPQEPPPKQPATARLPAFMIGERARPAPSTSPVAPLAMDAKTHARMARGKLAPEDRIDLHGMTLAEAHPELVHFILNAQSQGLRLLLVITGKGRPDAQPRPTGLLRHQVPHWLRLPPLAGAVLQVREAHLKHGGSGAFYVYLRRR